MLVDISIIITSVYYSGDLLSKWRIYVFLTFSLSSIAIQFLIMQRINSKTIRDNTNKQFRLDILYKGILVIFSFASIISILICYQIIFLSYFSTFLVSMVVSSSYVTSMFILSLLSYRLISWYNNSDTKNYTILLYSISFTLIIISEFFSMVFTILVLDDKSNSIYPRLGLAIPLFSPGSGTLQEFVLYSNYYTTFLSFVAMWFSTVLILRYYARNISALRFWPLVSFPLAFLVLQYIIQDTYFMRMIFLSWSGFSNMHLTIIFWISKPICGILFGFVFWSLVRHVRNANMRFYLSISAFGIVMLIIANQAPAVASSLSFPPFGLIAISFLSLSSYLLFTGIYNSVVLMSYDALLKKSISILADKFNLWESMSTSESILENENKINKINKIMKSNQDKYADSTGIRHQVSDSEILDYINELMMEKQTKE